MTLPDVRRAALRLHASREGAWLSPARRPTPLTSFVGRARDVAAVTELLTEARLVTLTGAAGSGKTRLALAVAERLAADSAAWVDLAALTDPSLLVTHVAAQVGIREEKNRTPIETLSAVLRGRPVVLVLDNCEHLADACAALVEQLLHECAALRVLATSREPLGIGGEHAWLVPLLDANEAAALFVERARAVLPTFGPTATREDADVVAAICRRLDGLPLAIELAAARVSVLAPGQILARLDEGLRLLGAGSRTAPPRQRTLRGAIDWSYALLGDTERLLLARLAVFSGSFSLTAVERVCADHRLPADAVLEPLAALVEKSLVLMELRAGEARYRLLEVVRQYAGERLVASGEAAALRARHADFFLELAERDPLGMLGYGGRDWLARLTDEMPNLRAVFEWGVGAREGAEAALRLGGALNWFWVTTGQFAEGRARLTATLAHAEHANARTRAHAMTALGCLGLCLRDRTIFRPQIEESVRLLSRQQDPTGLASALLHLGIADLMDGDAARAFDTLTEAVAVARTTNQPALVAQALYWLGSSARRRGDLPAARAAVEEAATLARRPGLEFAFAYCAARLGVLHHLAGDHAAALTWLGQAVAMHRPGIDLDRWEMIPVLDGVAGVAVARGQAERAARLLGAAEAFCDCGDVTAPLDLREFHDEFAAAARAALGDDGFDRAREQGATLDLDTALQEAAALVDGLAGPGTTPAAPLQRPAGARPVLRVLALGRLEIQRDGAAVPSAAWRAARPRELLLYLLCHRAGRSRDQIALVFWPDAAPAQIKNNFHVALHYLRKALGRTDLVLFDDERYRVNWELGVEFDAADFERDVRTALRAPPADLPVDSLRATLARYRGDFLEDAAVGDWHLETRDHLRRLYIDGLFSLGKRDESAGEFADAAETYRRVLSVDPLDEAASRGVMRCHAELGERAEALREFERLSLRLRSELDTEPDPETHALADKLKRPGSPGAD